MTIELSTKPELQLNNRKPGAYVIKDGVRVPDLNDSAMREKQKTTAPQIEEEKKSES